MTYLPLFPQHCPQPWEHPYTSHWYGVLVCLTCRQQRDDKQATPARREEVTASHDSGHPK